MKTHYKQPFTNYQKCKPYASKKLRGENVTENYMDTTCMNCITRMSPGEMMWHDKNNKEWIAHKAKDGRRKGVKKPTVIQHREVERKAPIKKKESGVIGFIKFLFGGA